MIDALLTSQDHSAQNDQLRINQQSSKSGSTMFDKLKDKLQRNKEIPEEDVKKYTGMDRDQLKEWSKDRPDVGGNQLAGKINMGTSGGLGMPNHFSYTGRGDSAAAEMKFPPEQKKAAKEVDGDSE